MKVIIVLGLLISICSKNSLVACEDSSISAVSRPNNEKTVNLPDDGKKADTGASKEI